MKKLILFVLVLVLSLTAVSAFGASNSLTIKHGTYDEEAGIFPTIKEALVFAEAESMNEVEIILDEDHELGKSYSAINSEYPDDEPEEHDEDDVITLDASSYENVKSITITGGKKITASSGYRHFDIDNEEITLVLNNLTLTGNDDGGGISLSKGSLEASSVKFSSMNATNGGAVCITDKGNATFTDCTFSDNKADYGGALYLSGTGSINFAGNFTFSTNTATNDGGAIYITGTGVSSSSLAFGATKRPYGAVSAATPITGLFQNNTAVNGGAIDIMSGGQADMFGTVTFRDNKATGNGGAIRVSGTGKIIDSGATLEFINNHAGYTVSTTPLLPNEFSANVKDPTKTAMPSSGFGGAICFDGTAASTLGTATFEENDACLGGAVYVSNVNTVNFSSQVRFGTSSGNKAYIGGALYLANGTTNFNGNADFSFNKALDSGGALYTVQNGNENLTFSAPVVFNRNEANYDKEDFGDGGAVWWGMQSSAFKTTFANGVTFSYNSTGGTQGVTTNPPTVSSGTSVNVPANGGALYITDTGVLTIDSTANYVFENNYAYNCGGAIYTDSAPVTIISNNFNVKNSAGVYGGFVYSKTGAITVQDTSISRQEAAYGGAIFGTSVTINSSSDLSFNNSTGTNNPEGGGAIFATTSLTVNDSSFTNNTAKNIGGAVFVAPASASNATVSMTNAFFDNNIADKNGGALYLSSNCNTQLVETSFANNVGQNGGAVYADGTITVEKSFFINNTALGGNGGAFRYSQSGSGAGSFTLSSSMFHVNVATGGQGGAIWVESDYALIEGNTFNDNTANGGTNARGGAILIDTSSSRSSRIPCGDIQRCTFTNNKAQGGSTDSCGGALATLGKVSVTSCTFSKGNMATTKGGAIYIGDNSATKNVDSQLTLFATIAVGNLTGTPGWGEDIWMQNGSLNSGNYNRIGYYGTGSGNGTWLGLTNDVQNASYTTQSFFSGKSDLSVNERTGAGRYPSIPPMIGSARYTGILQYIGSEQILSGQVRLLTLMLSEDAKLPVAQRATNQIPTNLKRTLPRYDERGVDIWALMTSPDIGAVMYDKVSQWQGRPGNETNVIDRIQMSGIPNTLKSAGTTVSLLALVYYTNGHVAYGGPDEPVTWSTDPENSSVIYVDPDHGYLIAKAPGTATVKVTTNRQKDGGGYATDSRVVRVESSMATYMNTVSEQYQNYFISYIGEIAEHDLSLALADVSVSAVKATSFQRNFKAVWNVDSASQITELTDSTPTFSTPTSYQNSEGLAASKGAAVSINFPGRKAGDLFPLTYSWNLSGEEVKAVLGSDLSGQLANNALAAKLFSAFRIDYQTASKTWPVIGSGGVSGSDAMQAGALVLKKADGDRGVHVELTVYLANVQASGNSDGPQLVKGAGSNRLLVVPDGSDDGLITGTMWMVQKASGSGGNSGNGGNNSNTGGNNNSGSGGDSGGGGGGGCSAFGLGILGAIVFILRRK